MTFGGGVGSVANGDTLDFDVGVTAADGDDITVHLTPSTDGLLPQAGSHADIMLQFGLSGSSPSRTNSLGTPTHDRVAMRIRNTDRNENDLLTLTGGVSFTAGDSVTLQSAHLAYVSSMTIPVGTSVVITGNNFSISGSPALGPASSYDLVLVFSSAPGRAYEVSVTAGF